MMPTQDLSPEAVEAHTRAAYEACHPDDGFDDLVRRAAFSKEDKCLLRDWLAAVRRRLERQGVDMQAPPPSRTITGATIAAARPALRTAHGR